jgi:beta-1,4-N-acetylglucosaminyltransferase
MIFVTVGNDFRSFDRLLRKIDEIALRTPKEIVIQKGYSTYRPRNAKYFDFVPMDTAVEYVKNSELVISHAGIGTIILCKEYGIPILILPRRKKYGEHMNDHQMEIARILEEKESENIFVVYEEDQLEEKILNFLKQGTAYRPVQNWGKENLVRAIKEFIEMT